MFAGLPTDMDDCCESKANGLAVLRERQGREWRLHDHYIGEAAR